MADGVHGVADAQLPERPILRPAAASTAAAALEVGGRVDAEVVAGATGATLHEVLDEVLDGGQLLASRGQQELARHVPRVVNGPGMNLMYSGFE